MTSAPIEQAAGGDPGRADEPPPAEGAEAGEPRWSAWQAIAAYFVSYLAAVLLVGTVIVAGGELLGTGTDVRAPGVIAVGVLVQTTVLIGTAVVFAGMTRRPRPADFGFRRAPFWQTVGWVALGFAVYFTLAVAYNAIFQPQGEQSVARDLGLDRGTASLVAGGFAVIVLAPIGEETLYRGFVYRGLRNSFARRFGNTPGITVAALLAGALFSVVHFTDTEVLPILPILWLLGVVFCLVYELSRSIYATIAMHSIINTLAFVTFAKQDDWIGLVYCAAMVGACVLAPRFLWRGAGRVTTTR